MRQLPNPELHSLGREGGRETIYFDGSRLGNETAAPLTIPF